jgi:hypothetical protein
VVPDFFLLPEELAFSEGNMKVTIALSESSVEFFYTEQEILCILPANDTSLA